MSKIYLQHLLLKEQKVWECCYQDTFMSCMSAFHATCTYSLLVLDVSQIQYSSAKVYVVNPLGVVSPPACQPLMYLTYNWATHIVSSISLRIQIRVIFRHSFSNLDIGHLTLKINILLPLSISAIQLGCTFSLTNLCLVFQAE